jgi:hypothetical protein
LGPPGRKLIEEFMDDHPSTYESEPRRSLNSSSN